MRITVIRDGLGSSGSPIGAASALAKPWACHLGPATVQHARRRQRPIGLAGAGRGWLEVLEPLATRAQMWICMALADGRKQQLFLRRATFCGRVSVMVWLAGEADVSSWRFFAF
jgi:hypothetical protein